MILVAGSANLDFVVKAHHIPSPGETVLGRNFQTYPGGKGANQAVASSLAGATPTRMLLALGNDSMAQTLKQSLGDSGVELELITTPETPTGAAFICVSDDAQNAITVAPGANSCLRPEHLPSLNGVSHLLMQLEIPAGTVKAYAKAAKSLGVKVVLNAAPAQKLDAELLDCLDILIVNQQELTVVSGCTGSMNEALEMVPVPTVIVTLGHKGSCAFNAQSKEIIVQPAFQVTAIDTTGAGDTFCGALVARLSQGQKLADAMRYASAASALCCMKMGAQSSIPKAAEVTEFLDKQA